MYLSIGSALNDQIFKHQMQSHIKQHLDLFTDNVILTVVFAGPIRSLLHHLSYSRLYEKSSL